MALNITLIMASALEEPMHNNNPFMPISLPLLAATAPEHNYTIIDLLAGDKLDYEKPADLVGISLRFSSEERAYEVAEEYRKRNVPVVLGGPQVSAKPFEAILTSYPRSKRLSLSPSAICSSSSTTSIRTFF